MKTKLNDALSVFVSITQRATADKSINYDNPPFESRDSKVCRIFKQKAVLINDKEIIEKRVIKLNGKELRSSAFKDWTSKQFDLDKLSMFNLYCKFLQAFKSKGLNEFAEEINVVEKKYNNLFRNIADECIRCKVLELCVINCGSASKNIVKPFNPINERNSTLLRREKRNITMYTPDMFENALETAHVVYSPYYTNEQERGKKIKDIYNQILIGYQSEL